MSVSMKSPSVIGCFLLIIPILPYSCTTGKDTKDNDPVRQQHTDTIEIKQMAFYPAEIAVSKGDTIIFINHDPVDHDITEEEKRIWSSSPIPPGHSWSKVINEPSNYFCSLHVVMKGKITVK